MSKGKGQRYGYLALEGVAVGCRDYVGAEVLVCYVLPADTLLVMSSTTIPLCGAHPSTFVSMSWYALTKVSASLSVRHFLCDVPSTGKSLISSTLRMLTSCILV